MLAAPVGILMLTGGIPYRVGAAHLRERPAPQIDDATCVLHLRLNVLSRKTRITVNMENGKALKIKGLASILAIFKIIANDGLDLGK